MSKRRTVIMSVVAVIALVLVLNAGSLLASIPLGFRPTALGSIRSRCRLVVGRLSSRCVDAVMLEIIHVVGRLGHLGPSSAHVMLPAVGRPRSDFSGCGRWHDVRRSTVSLATCATTLRRRAIASRAHDDWRRRACESRVVVAETWLSTSWEVKMEIISKPRTPPGWP